MKVAVVNFYQNGDHRGVAAYSTLEVARNRLTVEGYGLLLDSAAGRLETWERGRFGVELARIAICFVFDEEQV